MAKSTGKLNNNELKPAEQKTTAAFKLLNDQIKILKQSLKKTQDELEKYRSKYYESEKNNAVHLSRGGTLALHEILKFIISAVCGGIGVNLITNAQYIPGSIIMTVGIIFYSLIVFSDKKF